MMIKCILLYFGSKFCFVNELCLWALLQAPYFVVNIASYVKQTQDDFPYCDFFFF